ncbi:helix-turn-helix domain-containing protein [Rhizobium sp. LC145]|uniref:winged helix-turn-helix transcriptional regulator n=1 Tax=Rhizobium sp. LC145 TaxID=1120688 RepID=UPI00062A380D|nr:helix-turn-helix domain-containing protein [Rhizobium sp. LC145]KKX28100.1 HxlR family transcriptional regulator [Rhizobium sp. LC145]TKT54445.1 helix-turn-helix transcriptional regulator [Rhizobiaceae bacterium LC148]
MKRLPDDDCGFATALNVIGGKWKTDILWEINLAPRRFGELRRILSGVSEKVLAQQLREMEADDLIRREVFPGKVQRVEYSVTDFGRSLNEAVTVMADWGKAFEIRMAEKAEEEARPPMASPVALRA